MCVRRADVVLAAIFALTAFGALAQVQPPASPAPAAPPAATVPAPKPVPAADPEARIRQLEERLDLALALKDQRIESVKESSENTFRVLSIVGALSAALLIFLTIRDTIYRFGETQRQRSIDAIVKETMQQQIRMGELHLGEAGSHLRHQGEGVQSVNQVIDVVKRTLEFRQQQEEMVADTLLEIKRIKEERDRVREQRRTNAMSILDNFKTMSRMEFASLTEEQYRRGIRLQGLVRELNDFLDNRENYEVAGSLLYTCGVISYYDNDVVEAKGWLDRAAAARAAGHEGELENNKNYRLRFAFIHYFRALIQKNWGDLAYAQYEITQSAKLLEDRSKEFLTPVTRAEILSYIEGEEERCRTELRKLLEQLSRLDKLDANQEKLRNRMLMLMGNTYFVKRNFREALDQYNLAIGFKPGDYYALVAAAQCERELENADAAGELFRRGLNAIDHSSHFRRKRERVTRAVIAVTAAIAAKECREDARREQWSRDAHELLSGELRVDGMSPNFFSPLTKRLVDAATLLKELDA